MSASASSRLSLLGGALLAAVSCAIGPSTGDAPGGAQDAGPDGRFACMTEADCPAPPKPCMRASCNVGVCDVRNVPKGAIVTKDVPADCHAIVCDGAGNTETVVDPSRLPAVSATCMAGTCDMAGTPGMVPAGAGAACTSSGGRRCDGAGNCVECLGASDCPTGQSCNALKSCEVPPCMDGFKDSRETDVDCGGVCPPCGAGRMCKQGSDCLSNACDALMRTCLGPACSDGMKDGNETGVDCGGSCSACALGSGCAVDQDCVSKACDAVSLTCVADQCQDHRKENNETDVDCGGGACPGCANGLVCRINTDCLSGDCNATSHTCVVHIDPCTDGMRDGAETDVDCGGGICPRCALGKTCFLDFDCASNACDGIAGVCVADPCTDHRFDGTETDVDCGGANACARCPVGKKCRADTDCTAGATCNPGIPHLCM